MIGAGDVTVVIDQKALQALMASPSGPVAKHLGRLGAKIEGRSKQLASGELVNVDTGRYRSSLTWRLFTRGSTVGVAIGSGVYYALFLELGTSRMSARPVLQTAAREILGASKI